MLATPDPNGRFERIRRLGEGTTGVVYEALDRERGTRVALKTLRYATSESRGGRPGAVKT
jgi:serine/threonine protein kinase